MNSVNLVMDLVNGNPESDSEDIAAKLDEELTKMSNKELAEDLTTIAANFGMSGRVTSLGILYATIILEAASRLGGKNEDEDEKE